MNARALRFLVASLALGCSLALIHIASTLTFQVPFDPDEGWNAAFTKHLLTTNSPYPPLHSLLTNNYPPLSFYAVAALTHLTGDAVVAGRLLAFTALLATALGIFTALRRMDCSREASGLGALLFLVAILLTSDYAGMDDPQMFGHAIAIGGLLLVLPEPRIPRRMVGAALLFTVALFIKHNLIILPAATALWLILANRRLATTFIFSGIVFALIGLGLFKAFFGFNLLPVIASPRAYSLAHLWTTFSAWLPWGAPLLAGAIALLILARHDRYAMFSLIYAAAATVIGLYFLGGEGVDMNAMFDADIALALCAALLIDGFSTPAWRLPAIAGLGLTVLFSFFSIEPNWRSTDFWLRPLAEERRAAAQEIALIRATKGPVLCETLALCYWAGKSAEADVFNLSEAYRTGTRSDADLIQAFAAKRYALVEFEDMEHFPLTPRIRSALLENYRMTLEGDDGTFFVPR
jgi:hypothetical protein